MTGVVALEAAWRRSDEIFALVADAALACQPIRLRQPLLFYVGHLPAFAWNQLGRGVLGHEPFAPAFDALFERGIDPEEEHDPGRAWPETGRVLAYRDRVRDELRRQTFDVDGADGRGAGPERVRMVLEHELMHHETLLYMLARLSPDRFESTPQAPAREEAHPPSWIDVPGGRVVLGTRDAEFAWDNETPALEVDVAPLRIASTPVTNREVLEFVQDGGYTRPQWWSPLAWTWIERAGVRRPPTWTGDRADDPEGVQAVGRVVPFDVAGAWPASVSHAEAQAFARWRGARLPTEAELVHARTGASPAGAHLGFDRWHPRAAGANGNDVAACGLRDAWGNGWEWTSTVFGPLPGFRPHPAYPGYSADFFDGKHYVLRGGSWATDRRLARPGFRNWFQAHYPWVFSKFRCAAPA